MALISETLMHGYLLEQRGAKILEKDYGFAIYTIKDKECFIEDIYTTPKHRKAEYATAIADEICESVKDICTTVKGCVEQDAKHKTRSIAVLHGYGMEFFYETQDYIYFKKDIK